MMSGSPASTTSTPVESSLLKHARSILRTEGQTLLDLAQRLDGSFVRAVEVLSACRGSVIVSGMGKAGLVGQKIAATLASTGTRSHFLHPAEAVHGDLGRVHVDDVMLLLSYSGQTDEIVRLLAPLSAIPVPMIAVTSNRESPLGRQATVTLELGHLVEACPLGLAPTTSTTAMLALGDALAVVASDRRGFQREDFARFHPGGSLGRQLAKVEDVMRPLSQCRLASEILTVRDVLIQARQPGRRTGAIMITDASGRLAGIFTDSDLARLFEQRRDGALDGPIGQVMTRHPSTITRGERLQDAVQRLASRKISELPVVEANGYPCGLIDITDVVERWPDETPQTDHPATTPPDSDEHVEGATIIPLTSYSRPNVAS